MKKLSIYYTEGHASIEVVNGASRQSSANNMADAIKSMHPADLPVLVAFCKAVLSFVETEGKRNQFIEKF